MPSADDVTRVADTCNVWVLRRGGDAVCVDFGSGRVLDLLGELGVERVTDVLVTHFHRDGVQGLRRAAEAGIRIWVPPVEQDFFTDTADLWARTRLENDYDMLQTRFAPLESVAVDGTVAEYRTRAYGGIDVFTLPTPGHTPGSVTYLAEVGGRTVAFTGDLLYGPGARRGARRLSGRHCGARATRPDRRRPRRRRHAVRSASRGAGDGDVNRSCTQEQE